MGYLQGQDQRRSSGKRHGHRTRQKDGRRESRLYTTWRAMKQRVLDPKHPSYDHYQEMGVTICEEWLDFDRFAKDVVEEIGEHPGKGYTLGRSTPFSNYGPGEVDWLTYSQQNVSLHSQYADLVKVDGVEMTKVEWAEHLNIRYKTLLERLRNGWGDDAYRYPKGKRRPAK